MRRSSPKSNSWLPSVARSRPIAFSAAIICSPLKTLDASETAEPVDGDGGVDVVDLQERQRRPRPRRRRLFLLRRPAKDETAEDAENAEDLCSASPDASDQTSDSHFGTCWSSTLPPLRTMPTLAPRIASP